jgi:ABC-type Fe3+/spermidine/putrescine transport system ATPase subunit
MSATALDVDRVEANYGPVQVLKGVSLAVARGEFVALLGSSGCGKTTLLRAISGFVPVAAGAIRMNGRDITREPPDKREMAMVFQSYALWPHMTAAQNIGYGLRLRGMGKADIAARTERVLGMLKLDGLGARNVTQLSGGQRQRVALGRALAINPQILLLDEPLSNLDARIREDVRHEIKALQKLLGITAIHVTHDREEAMVMADRIVILDAGQIAQVGPPDEVYNRPASPFVAAFMGATNVMELTIGAEGASIVVEAGPHNDRAVLPGGLPSFRGRTVMHFRSEAATLIPPDGAAGSGALVLRGRIVQRSYPGGFWRYAVRVGERQFMVDDTRRFDDGAMTAIRLPAGAIHLYPMDGEKRIAA